MVFRNPAADDDVKPYVYCSPSEFTNFISLKKTLLVLHLTTSNSFIWVWELCYTYLDEKGCLLFE
jgi:hypothetical protein